uniref:Ketosynthase family 3 (KS3) domain-containing protein n=1 Tax=Timema poppense TaxID=170557 RepID=A0A7R9DAV7_TIMPO|nr:unnamed protein product [Timema poppensis]
MLLTEIDVSLSPEDVKNTRMGIVMGSVFSESENMWIYKGAGFGILGHSRTMLANRVSYWLNCYGPSYALLSGDTNGIEGLTLASEAIRNGHCESALVGVVSFEILPEMSQHYKGLKLLAEDGNNRSFDDDASGFALSEGIVTMYLQKAKDAKRIYASIVHSQFECYGDRKSGYIVPLEYPLTSLLSSFYQQCGIDPSLISYLEADGSGIKSRDTIELNAVAKVLLNNRQSPLLIGSIKSNLGHTSAASALISVVKVLIAMEAGKIPANNNFNKPSQQVPALVEGRLKVVTETMPWSGGLAAVNSVGLSGVVGHIVLRSHNKEKVNGGLPTDELPRLLVISGRTEEGLEETFNKGDRYSLSYFLFGTDSLAPQVRASVDYDEENPDLNREAARRYTEKNPDVNRAAVKRYEENPNVNRPSESK